MDEKYFVTTLEVRVSSDEKITDLCALELAIARQIEKSLSLKEEPIVLIQETNTEIAYSQEDGAEIDTEPDFTLGPAWKRRDGGRIPTMAEQEGDSPQRQDSTSWMDTIIESGNQPW